MQLIIELIILKLSVNKDFGAKGPARKLFMEKKAPDWKNNCIRFYAQKAPLYYNLSNCLISHSCF